MLYSVAFVALGAGCSGGGASSGVPHSRPSATASASQPASATPAATATPVPSPTATPVPIPSGTPVATPTATPSALSIPFNDFTTYGYDAARDGYNPNSTAFTPAALGGLHLAWQADLAALGTQTQPIVVTGVAADPELIVGGSGTGAGMEAFDARSGRQLWASALGSAQFLCGSTAQLGVAGTAVYDPTTHAVYVGLNLNTGIGTPTQDDIVALDPGSGAVLAVVNITPVVLAGEADFVHTALTLGPNGTLYAGTGSSCDSPSWRGRVVAVDEHSLTLASTFFPVYDQTQAPAPGAFSGGGVWGWGGVSIDAAGSVYAGIGNGDSSGVNAAPFAPSTTELVGFANNLVQLSPDLSTVTGANFPGFAGAMSGDLDLAGTPVLAQTVRCGLRVAVQGKSGNFYVYDAHAISNGPVASFALSESNYSAAYMGNAAFSPATGYLYADVSSAMQGGLFAPGMLAIDPCSGSAAWHAAFGPDSFATADIEPRSPAAPSAGGVVFVGTPCRRDANNGCNGTGNQGGAVWALDALTGTVLGGGLPILFTGDHIRMPPTIDGAWLFVLDESGDLYGLTLDPSYATIPNRITRARRPSVRFR
jgi:hypothetical protein